LFIKNYPEGHDKQYPSVSQVVHSELQGNTQLSALEIQEAHLVLSQTLHFPFSKNLPTTQVSQV